MFRKYILISALFFLCSCKDKIVTALVQNEPYTSKNSVSEEKFTYDRDVSNNGTAVLFCNKNQKQYIVAVNLANGNILWETPISILSFDNFYSNNNYGIIYDYDKFTVYDLRNGTKVFDHSLDNQYQQMAFKHENYFVTAEKNNKKINVFDLGKGQVWSNDIDGIIDYTAGQFPLLIDHNLLVCNDVLYLKFVNTIRAFDIKTGNLISKFEFKKPINLIAQNGREVFVLHNNESIYSYNPVKNDTTHIYTFDKKIIEYKFFLAKNNENLLLYDYGNFNVYSINFIAKKLNWIYNHSNFPVTNGYNTVYFENGNIYIPNGGFDGSSPHRTIVIDVNDGNTINITPPSTELLPYRHYYGSLLNDSKYYVKYGLVDKSVYFYGFSPDLQNVLWKYKSPQNETISLSVSSDLGVYNQYIYYPLIKKTKSGFIVLNSKNQFEYFDFSTSGIKYTSKFDNTYQVIRFLDVIE